MKKEIWKDIQGYEGLYQISNLGRIKSLERDIIYSNGKIQHYKGKILTPNSDKDDYKTIKLCKNGIIKRYLVHRLIAITFIPNPDNLPCVNHKDENKQNNNIENLEWCSVAYNNCYGSRLEKLSSKMKGRKVSEETKQKIRVSKKLINRPVSEKHHQSIIKSNKETKGKKVLQYSLNGDLIKVWNTTREVDVEFGKSVHSSISRCCMGKQKTAQGFIWKYKDVS